MHVQVRGSIQGKTDRFNKDMWRSIGSFEAHKSKDEMAESYLVLGILNNEIRYIRKAFGEFVKCYPKHLAGMLECMHWMMGNADLSTFPDLTRVILGMENLADIVDMLLSFNKGINNNFLDKLLCFYGFQKHETEQYVAVYPGHVTLALQLLIENEHLSPEALRSIELREKKRAREYLAAYLVCRGRPWHKKLVELIRQARLNQSVSLEGLLKADMWWIAFQHYSNITFAEHSTEAPLYDSLQCFVVDLCRCDAKISTVKYILSYLTKGSHSKIYPRVKDIRKFALRHAHHLIQQLCPPHHVTATKNMQQVLLLYNVFNLQEEENNMPINALREFEKDILLKLISGTQSEVSLAENYFRVITNRNGSIKEVKCLANKLYNALDALFRLNEPLDAALRFVQFAEQRGISDTHFLFNSDILFWMEYFSTLLLLLLANSRIYSKSTLLLSNSYVHNLKLIDILYHRTEKISVSILRHRTSSEIGRLRYWVSRITGVAAKITNFITNTRLPERRSDLEDSMQRIVVLNLTILCNTHLVTSRIEKGLVLCLRNICPITVHSNHIQGIVAGLKQAQCQRDFFILLQNVTKNDYTKNYCLSKDGDIDVVGIPVVDSMSTKCYRLPIHINANINSNGSTTRNTVTTEIEQTSWTVHMQQMMQRVVRRWRFHARMRHFFEYLRMQIEDEGSADGDIYEGDDNTNLDSAIETLTDEEKRICGRSFWRWLFLARSRHIRRYLRKQINAELVMDIERIFYMVRITNEECGICGMHFEIENMDNENVERMKGSHIKDTNHIQKNEELNTFVSTVYNKQVARVRREAERFLDKYHGNNRISINEIESEMRRLVISLERVQEETRIIVENQAWSSSDELLKGIHILLDALETCRSYVRNRLKRQDEVRTS